MGVDSKAGKFCREAPSISSNSNSTKMKNFTLSLFFLLICIQAYSETWVVVNSGFTFSPATLTILQGDTVIFDLAQDHNSTEVSQTTWMANGSTPLPGGWMTAFGGGMVLPADLTVGTHWYVCQPHSGMGMKGMIIVEQSTAVDDARPSTAFSIYPNPTTGKVQLTIAEQDLSTPYTMEVYDLAGNKVLSRADVDLNASSEIDLTGLTKGIYYVRFRNGLDIYNRRVVVQ